MDQTRILQNEAIIAVVAYRVLINNWRTPTKKITTDEIGYNKFQITEYPPLAYVVAAIVSIVIGCSCSPSSAIK